MKRQNLLALTLCVLVFVTGFLIKGNINLYFNLAGFMIVVGGSTAAALLSFRLERLKIVCKVVRASYGRRIKSENEIVDILIDLAIKSRMKGILSLQTYDRPRKTGFKTACFFGHFSKWTLANFYNQPFFSWQSCAKGC